MSINLPKGTFESMILLFPLVKSGEIGPLRRSLKHRRTAVVGFPGIFWSKGVGEGYGIFHKCCWFTGCGHFQWNGLKIHQLTYVAGGSERVLEKVENHNQIARWGTCVLLFCCMAGRQSIVLLVMLSIYACFSNWVREENGVKSQWDQGIWMCDMYDNCYCHPINVHINSMLRYIYIYIFFALNLVSLQTYLDPFPNPQIFLWDLISWGGFPDYHLVDSRQCSCRRLCWTPSQGDSMTVGDPDHGWPWSCRLRQKVKGSVKCSFFLMYLTEIEIEKEKVSCWI